MFQNKTKQNKLSKVCCIILILGVLVFMIDITKSPKKQMSVKLTTQIIKIYQQNISPILQGKVNCVYQISCSDYAILAVEKYGFVKGSYLSMGRLINCRQSVDPLEEWDKP